MSAHKCNINTDQSADDSNIQSNNNYATPADNFNLNNTKEVAQSPDICINEDIITTSPTLYGGSQINIPQNVTSETEYDHRTGFWKSNLSNTSNWKIHKQNSYFKGQISKFLLQNVTLVVSYPLY